MPDWKAVLDEIKGMKKAQEAPTPKEEEPEEPQVTVPEKHWWHLADALSRNDELLQAILEQLQTMEQVTPPTVPAPPPDYEGPVIPPGIESAVQLTAEEQVRTRKLLEGFNFITGQSTVQTAGTAVEVVSTVRTYYLIVRSHANNSGEVYVGGRGVSATSGYVIGAGEAIAISIDNLKKSVWVDAATAGDGVSWIALVD